jgi:hypothetical protein
VAVDVEHGGLVLLGASRNEEIGDGKAVAAFLSELPVCRHSDEDRLGVYAQLIRAGRDGLRSWWTRVAERLS